MPDDDEKSAPLVLEEGFLFFQELRHPEAAALYQRAKDQPIPLVVGGQEVGTVQALSMAIGGRPTSRVVALRIASVTGEELTP